MTGRECMKYRERLFINSKRKKVSFFICQAIYIQLINRLNFTVVSKADSLHKKITLRCMRHGRYKKASLSLEAAIVMPIVVFMFMLGFQILLFGGLQLCVAYKTINTINSYSSYGYAERRYDGDNLKGMSYLLTAPMYLACSDCIKVTGVEDFVITEEKTEDEYEAVTVSYRYRIAAPFSSLYAFNVRQSFLYKPYYGIYDKKKILENEQGKNEENQEEYVYVTENGAVYHTSMNCSYIKSDVRQCFSCNIEYERNSNGRRYTACEKCGESGYSEVYYITAYGKRYHTSMECSALTHNVVSITKEKAEEQKLRLCKKCALEVKFGG